MQQVAKWRHNCKQFTRESRWPLALKQCNLPPFQLFGCKRNLGKKHQSPSNKGGIFSNDLSKNHIASEKLGNPPDFSIGVLRFVYHFNEWMNLICTTLFHNFTFICSGCFYQRCPRVRITGIYIGSSLYQKTTNVHMTYNGKNNWATV